MRRAIRKTAIAVIVAMTAVLASCRSSKRTRTSNFCVEIMGIGSIRWAYQSVPVDTTTLIFPYDKDNRK